MDKLADLLPSTTLQPHQERVLNKLKQHPGAMLLYWQLGSGKSLGSIAAAEQLGKPYTAIMPASLRSNFKQQQDKFTDNSLPSSIISYNALSANKPVKNNQTLIFDEAHRLRNSTSKQTERAINLADQSDTNILSTGTPVVNDPSDFAPLMSMLTRKRVSPQEFRERYVRERQVSPGIIKRILGYTPGVVEDIAHPDELKALLKGHVDYYQPDKPVVPVRNEDVVTEMSSEQSHLYNAMWDKLPWILRWKLKWHFPLNRKELVRMTAFLTGPRQVGLSTLPFMRDKWDPDKALQQSPKLLKAVSNLQDKLKDERTKALVFSNFIDAGLTPYSHALTKANIPHAIFSGKLNDQQRKQLVDDYNIGKTRVALLGPSGTEGLSFKGTQLIQLLDSPWNSTRSRQAVGRGLRYDSHFDLPDDLQNVTVQRYISRLPLGWKDKLLSSIGFNREANRAAADDHLIQLSKRKDLLNNKFLNLLKEIGNDKE